MSRRERIPEQWQGGYGSSRVTECPQLVNWFWAPQSAAIAGRINSLTTVQGPRSAFTVARLAVTRARHFAVEPGDTITLSVAGCWPALPPTIVGCDVAFSIGAWTSNRSSRQKFRPVLWELAE